MTRWSSAEIRKTGRDTSLSYLGREQGGKDPVFLSIGTFQGLRKENPRKGRHLMLTKGAGAGLREQPDASWK